MRAIYLSEVGEVETRELPEPACGPADALVRVRAGGICGTDMSTYLGTHFLRRAPQILGHEVSGEVVAVGAEVSGWEPGERVFVDPQVDCGECEACRAGETTRCAAKQLPGLELPGLFSELIAMPAKTLHRIGDGVSWEQAAMVEPTSVAGHAVGRAELAEGAAVAVLGAGPIGALAALIAHTSFAARLLVADPKPSNRELVGGLIGCATADPTAGSLAAAGAKVSGGRGFDAVLVANHAPGCLADAVELVRPGGRIVAIAAAYEELPRVDVPSLVWHELELRGSFAFTPADVERSIELIEAGMDVAALVTHRHPPEQAAEAFAAIARGDGGHLKTIFEFAA